MLRYYLKKVSHRPWELAVKDIRTRLNSVGGAVK
ncbi:hypothetical protein EL80_5304 [Escherichia coli]|nr:hypothetical protein EL80_5304 [Escherichia coli]